MNITLNGQPHITHAAHIAALTEELGLNMKQVAIEQNRAIVPRSLYNAMPLTEGDAIEVVAFIGGG